MIYVCVTKNTPQEISNMNGYTGTTLIHTETLYLVWLWTSPNQQDLQAAQLVAMTAVNIT